MRGHWPADAIQGRTLRDSSRYGNHGTVEGDPVEVSGYRSGAISVDEDNYVVVSANCSLEVPSALTVAAWIRPTKLGAQRIIRKVSGENGFSLFLSPNGQVSVRLNDTNRLRVNSQQTYPTDGTAWMHIAATYDGKDIKLYVNGVLDGQASASTEFDGKDAPLSIGATSTGAFAFQGALDDVRLYNFALAEPGIQQLASQPLMPSPAQVAYVFILVTMGIGMGRRFRGFRRARLRWPEAPQPILASVVRAMRQAAAATQAPAELADAVPQSADDRVPSLASTVPPTRRWVPQGWRLASRERLGSRDKRGRSERGPGSRPRSGWSWLGGRRGVPVQESSGTTQGTSRGAHESVAGQPRDKDSVRRRL